MSHTFVALYHFYYLNELDPIINWINELSPTEGKLLINTCSGQSTISGKTNRIFSSEILTLNTPNIGKDIGGKLALIDLALNMDIKTDYYVLLHDKKSPHTTLGDIWRKKLQRIVEPENLKKIIRLFETDKKTGIIASAEFISNEYEDGNFNCSSDSILKALIKQYNLNLDSFDFVGGTMFWIRSEIIQRFFKKHSPLQIRSTLEKGDVLDINHGTITHAWERILSWIAIDQGFKIKGI